jgi:hypothetical protein
VRLNDLARREAVVAAPRATAHVDDGACRVVRGRAGAVFLGAAALHGRRGSVEHRRHGRRRGEQPVEPFPVDDSVAIELRETVVERGRLTQRLSVRADGAVERFGERRSELGARLEPPAEQCLVAAVRDPVDARPVAVADRRDAGVAESDRLID